MEGENDVANLVAFVVYGAECGEWDERSSVHAALVGLVDAHHAESHVADVDILADEIAHVAGQKLLCVVFTQHERLARLLYVNLVDKPAVEHLLLVYLHLVGINARQSDAHVVGVLCKRYAALLQFGSGVLHILLVALVGQSLVFVVEGYAPAFFQTVVSLRRISRAHHHRVVKKPVALYFLGVDESVAGSEQEDNHEDAPRHGKACQRGAQLVAPYGAPYLS